MVWLLALDTLAVDDGVEAGTFFLPESTWAEAVRIPHDSVILHGFLYRSGGGSLRWAAWEGGALGPDSLLASDSADAPEGWVWVELAEPLALSPGNLYAGWLGGEPPYYQYYDSRNDGYAWFYDGARWERDTSAPGDFLIRAVVEAVGVEEGPQEGAPALLAGPGWLEVRWRGPGTLRLYSPDGRLVLSLSRVWQGRHRLRFPGLGPGLFVAEMGGLSAKVLLR